MWVTLFASLTIGALSLFLPSNVLSSSRLLTILCNVMAAIVPTIEFFTKASNFPEVTRLYMSLMMLFSPFAFAALLCEFSREKRLLIPLPDKSTEAGKKYVRSATVWMFITPFLIYFQWFVNPGLDIYWMDFSSSRFDLAAYGFVITLAIPFMMGSFVHLATRIYVTEKLG